MLTLFTIQTKKNPVKRAALFLLLLLAAFICEAQSKDSADLYFQKGLLEKQNGRRLESLKQFERSAKYDVNNKAVLSELALAYMDLRRYPQAIETYKKLIDLGAGTAANYKQLLTLSFNFKNYDDVLLYADKLK